MLREKAGIDNSKKEEIEKIIKECTSNSKYGKRHDERAKKLEHDCNKIVESCSKFTESELTKAQVECDEIYNSLNTVSSDYITSRRVIAHLDMDAFFAQVETLEYPNYQNQPMAVGSFSMLATSNYEARKYGVRSAMPGFIAKKLCPDLVIVSPNFSKYEKISSRIHDILIHYDPAMVSVGLDEAYLDLTLNVSSDSDLHDCVEKIICNIKTEIFSALKLTCSIGVSFSRMLAKICSNINKPNGHYILLQNNPKNLDIREFVFQQPVSRINGVGDVTEKYLEAIGIKNCLDIFINRAKIWLTFGNSRAVWLFRSSYGLDDDEIFSEDKIQKKHHTIGIERTFNPTSISGILFLQLNKLITRVYNMLQSEDFLTNNITLKIKFDDFKTITRSKTLTYPTNSFDILKNIGIKLLTKEIQNSSFKIRLLGLRVSKISKDCKILSTLDNYFEPKTSPNLNYNSYIECPICSAKLYSDDRTVNRHIDECLNVSFINSPYHNPT